MKAVLKNYRQSPRKVRLIADMIRGKSVAAAKQALAFAPQKSSPALKKLLDSATANAREAGVSADALFIKTITVDKGQVLKRTRPFARGRAGRIGKTMSIVKIELSALTPVKKRVVKKTVTQPATGNRQPV